jgi:hypothetical protein
MYLDIKIHHPSAFQRVRQGGRRQVADAVQKLVDFEVSLTALSSAPKPKLEPAVAAELGAEAQGVVDCLVSLA